MKISTMQSPKSKSNTDCLLQSATATTKKHSIGSIVKTLLLLGACFGFLIPKGRSTYRDITSFNILKKQYVEDELQLSWDKQRISELEYEMQSMRSSFEETARFFIRHKNSLRQGNKLLEQAIRDEAKFSDKQRSEQVSRMKRFSNDVIATHDEFNEEEAMNIELKKVLADMRGQIEEHQKRLRGALKEEHI